MNPILKEYTSAFETIPFNEIDNNHYMPAIEVGIAKGKESIDRITSNPAAPTFENTILELEKSGKELEKVLNAFYPLLSAVADEQKMDISLKITPLLSDYSTSISLNRELWERIKCVYDATDISTLDPEDATLLTETYDGFVRSGALLEGDDREKLKKLSARLSELTTLFGQNVLKELATYEIFLSKNDLDGLPDHIVEHAAEMASAKGKNSEYLFTLSQPTYMSFMKHSSRRDLREKMYRLYSGRNITGEFSNMEIVKEIVMLRAEMAQLLGRKDYATFVLEHRMASTTEKVYELLHSLATAYRPAAEKEISELTAFATETEGADFVLQPWDYSYFFNKLREKKFAFNEEELRPYFKLENVVEGVFGLATKLYGLTFEKRDDIQVYHPDVAAYCVHDADGAYLGILYTDFFPRESKQPGAWMTDFKAQWKDSRTNSRPHVSIVMNFTKPTATKPSLLTPGEVRTFLHEFGHALHGLLSQTKYASLSGTNVRRDFVELPSQFNENFLTQKEFLDSFAHHYLTGEPIPQSFIERIVRSSQFGAAYACLRQLSFGLLDMAWHTITSPVSSIERFETEACELVRTLPKVDGALISPQFSHIFAGGYSAGYYSYKWAEVLDADAFELFLETGIFNPETANSFRRNILEKGGSENPELLYQRFRGKEPSVAALLRRDGIATD